MENAEELEKLLQYKDDEKVLEKLREIKGNAKKELKNYLKMTQNVDIDENAIFDIQIKRLHEYKRQQMNALYAIWKYKEIKKGNLPKRPLTMIFGAKAAPAYTVAKDIIHLILCLQQLIDNDPEVSPYFKIVMVENYNVTKAEKLIPVSYTHLDVYKRQEYEERHKKGDILSLFFEEFAEEHLIQPTFVTDHPIEISPLTKKKPENPEYVERFEFFMNGWEMANAYSELNDPIDQRERFKAQEELLAQGDEEANTTDEDFLNALEIGMPPTGGIGFGIDRMCMLLCDEEMCIRDRPCGEPGRAVRSRVGEPSEYKVGRQIHFRF